MKQYGNIDSIKSTSHSTFEIINPPCEVRDKAMILFESIWNHNEAENPDVLAYLIILIKIRMRYIDDNPYSLYYKHKKKE